MSAFICGNSWKRVFFCFIFGTELSLFLDEFSWDRGIWRIEILVLNARLMRMKSGWSIWLGGDFGFFWSFWCKINAKIRKVFTLWKFVKFVVKNLHAKIRKGFRKDSQRLEFVQICEICGYIKVVPLRQNLSQ